VLPNLPLKPHDLALLALHRREEAPPGGGAERLRRARLRRCLGRGPEPPLDVDEDRLGGTGDPLPTDPGDEGAVLRSRRADPDLPRLPGDPVVGDVDVVVAGRQVEAARGPSARLFEPVVLSESACRPIAMFSRPVLLLTSAWRPVATLPLPLMLSRSACRPVARLSWPVVLLKSAFRPVATLPLPVVLEVSA
jgi:hypothetical protein